MHKYLIELFWGVIARIVNIFISAKPKHWVFGSDYGNMYREGSKYMMEYLVENHKDIQCTFVTMNENVYDDLKLKGIPCVMNHSLKGIITIAKADAIFTCQYTTDILYVYKKKNRKFYYMVHGQSYKKGYDLASNQTKHKTIINYILDFAKKIFLVGYDIHEVSFMPVTSDYEGELMSQCFSGRVPMKTLGMPRNDSLFQPERMKDERWINEAQNKFVITYMPTHRLYGKGKPSPIPFIHNEKVQEWFKKNNILFVMKQHPNMVSKIKEDIKTDTVIDISRLRIDPMVAVYHTDLLITDYSSVWMDYLLLEKPLLFYYYDDFEESDTDLFFRIKDIASSYCCYSEEELFKQIKNAYESPDIYKPHEDFIAKFHKYTDGNSCQRYYDAVIADKY